MQVFSSVGDAAEPSPTATRTPTRYISLLSAFMILTTWSTSSSNVLYPYCFGVLGAVTGPLFMFLAFFVSWKITRFTVQAALATRATTFGDLGYALGGFKFRVMFEGSQILFQQLFLPVAIVLCASACQSLAGVANGTAANYDTFVACNGTFGILFACVSWLLIQVSREIENVTAIAYVTCALMLVMTMSMVMEAMTGKFAPQSRQILWTLKTLTR